MALREEIEKQGEWLFRWRSYLPLLLIGLFFGALRDFEYFSGSHYWDRTWELFCFCISFFGVCIRAFTVGSVRRGTSGRNTKELRAAALNTTGMYSIVRHPLYFANYIIWLGIILCVRSWWFFTIVSLIYWIYYERIMSAEEAFLKREFGASFEEWSKRTPPFFPKLGNWSSAELSFSFRNAVRREYSGLFAVVAIFTALDLVQESIVEQKLHIDTVWVWVFAFSFFLFLTLLTLKKRTNILVKGIR